MRSWCIPSRQLTAGRGFLFWLAVLPAVVGGLLALSVAPQSTGSAAAHAAGVVTAGVRDTDTRAVGTAAAPVVSVPGGITAPAGSRVQAPVQLDTGGKELAGILFSLDYDEACLAIDPADADHNRIPDAVQPQTPAGYTPYVSLDAGELDVVIVDYAPPLAPMPIQSIVLVITFDVICAPAKDGTRPAAVTFSGMPYASFGSPAGFNVPGEAVGTVITVLPPLPVTATPVATLGTATPWPTPTPRPEPTDGPTPGPTATPMPAATAPAPTGSVTPGTPPPQPTGSATPTAAATPVPVNRAPQAQPDFVFAVEDMAVEIEPLGNDGDPNGDPLALQTYVQPPQGRLTALPGNRLLYTPPADYNGVESFSYLVTDGRLSARALVRIEVAPINDAPSALNDVFSVPGGGRTAELDFLANDVDVDGDRLRLVEVYTPAQAGVTIIVKNAGQFTPLPGFSGPVEIGYRIADAAGVAVEGMALVQVEGGVPGQQLRPAAYLPWIGR